MATVHCLGCGLVGAYVARLLGEAGHEVHAYDLTKRDIAGVKVHVGDVFTQLKTLPEGLVINMLPGDFGHQATRELVHLGRKIVDLSFAEQTPDVLQEDALRKGATVVWDVGIAPGFSNLLVAQALRDQGRVDDVQIRVGGNPTKPDGIWSYMAPFSPYDVIAEYTRPARIISDGVTVVRPALDQRHRITVSGRGEMEAFLSDGLRSLLWTVPAQSMAEYTVRWPGHIQRYIDMKNEGTLNPETLVQSWALDPTKGEFTWMEVLVTANGEVIRWTVEDDGKGSDSSMARTTGLVTTAVALQWLETPELIPVGVHAPEELPPVFLKRASELFHEHGVQVHMTSPRTD
jgi:lysine 6-dehydrogenase